VLEDALQLAQQVETCSGIVGFLRLDTPRDRRRRAIPAGLLCPGQCLRNVLPPMPTQSGQPDTEAIRYRAVRFAIRYQRRVNRLALGMVTDRTSPWHLEPYWG